jgi:hypothetical protein
VGILDPDSEEDSLLPRIQITFLIQLGLFLTFSSPLYHILFFPRDKRKEEEY